MLDDSQINFKCYTSFMDTKQLRTFVVLAKEKKLLRLASHSLKYKRNIDMAYSYLKGDDSKRTFFENPYLSFKSAK